MIIKSVGYFPEACARNSAPIMSAVLSYLQSVGISTVQNSWDADAALIWSVLWHGRMVANRSVYEYYRTKSRPVIIIDIGALVRGHTWKISVNNITAEGYYGHQENLDLDRPKKLGIKLATAQNQNRTILIAAQHRNSQQVIKLGSMENWINQQITNVRAVTDRPIIVRPHPRSPINVKLLPADVHIETPAMLPNTYDSFDMSLNCHAVINHNSGPGIQAAIAGIRPIVDASSLAHPVSVAFRGIETAYDIDRSQWLIEMAHTEYTVQELLEGSWLKRIESAL